MNKLVINQNHINQVVKNVIESYENFFQDHQKTEFCSEDVQNEQVYKNFLYNLKDQKDIEKYLVEYLVGFGVVKDKVDKVVYQDVDVTDYYQDAYFRYFEDVD